MRLTVIGCSGSLPGPDSPASCYLLEADTGDPAGPPYRLLLDLGSGAIGALQNHVDLRSIAAVAITHLHADHCLDLCGFYVVRRHHPDGHWGRIPVYGPPGIAARMARGYDIAPEPGMSAEFEFHEYGDAELDEAGHTAGVLRIGPFSIATARVDHPVDAYALRVESGGRTLVYTGDTAPCQALEQLAAGADVMLAEASFRVGDDNPEHLHMTGPEVAAIASRAGVGRLVLTHVPPWFSRREIRDQAAPYVAGELTMAEPGLVIDI